MLRSLMWQPSLPLADMSKLPSNYWHGLAIKYLHYVFIAPWTTFPICIYDYLYTCHYIFCAALSGLRNSRITLLTFRKLSTVLFFVTVRQDGWAWNRVLRESFTTGIHYATTFEITLKLAKWRRSRRFYLIHLQSHYCYFWKISWLQ